MAICQSRGATEERRRAVKNDATTGATKNRIGAKIAFDKPSRPNALLLSFSKDDVTSFAENQIRRKQTLLTDISDNPSLCFMETIETKIFIILRHSYLFEMKTNFSWRFARGSTKQTSDEISHGPRIRHPSARPEIRPLLLPRGNLIVLQHLENASAFVVCFWFLSSCVLLPSSSRFWRPHIHHQTTT